MAGDVNFSNVVLLLSGGGANGSTAFVDGSISPKTPSVIAGNAKISTAQSKYGGSSMYFDGAGDWINYAAQTDFAFGTGDFSIDFFLYRNTVGAQQSLIHFNPQLGSGAYPEIYISPGGTLNYYASGGLRIAGASVMAASTWYHGELSRVSGVTRLFLEGVQQGSSYTDANNYIVGTNRPIVGAGGYDQSTPFNGHLHLRMRKGAGGGHTANFTPPSYFQAGRGEVEGIVRDATGAAAARTVRLMRRDTGSVLSSTISNATTGFYRLATPTLDEVVRIVHSNTTTAPLENDLIDRVIPA